MTAVYAVVLGVEGAVVALAGAVITATTVLNPNIVLYTHAVAAIGLGLTAGGVGTILVAAGVPDLASVLVVAAAFAFLLAGWRLSVDGIQSRDCVGRPPGNGHVSDGFEEGAE